MYKDLLSIDESKLRSKKLKNYVYENPYNNFINNRKEIINYLEEELSKESTDKKVTMQTSLLGILKDIPTLVNNDVGFFGFINDLAGAVNILTNFTISTNNNDTMVIDEYLINQLAATGGRLCKSFSEVADQSKKNTYLLAMDRYLQRNMVNYDEPFPEESDIEDTLYS